MPHTLYDWVGMVTYLALASVAMFGAFCGVLAWTRIGQKWFKSEDDQDLFLDSIEPDLLAGNFEAVEQTCGDDMRAVPMLVSLGVQNSHLGHAKIKQLLVERFQRDIMTDLEKSTGWMASIIKTAPMIGLFGTVVGMMGAFSTLSSGQVADPTRLAHDINIALYTTAAGLSIAVPLILTLNAVNNRIRKLEELVGSGVTRFLEALRIGLKQVGIERGP